MRRRAGESRCRVVVMLRSGGSCEICYRPAAQMAHRIGRRWSNWRASNILHLCLACHDQQQDNKGGPVLARSLGQTVYPVTGGLPTDTETVPVQCRWGRVFLKDDGSIEVAS